MKKTAFFLLFLFQMLHSNEDARGLSLHDRLPIATTESGPNAMVDGSVNVITGEFVDSINLINVASPEPIHWQAYYVNSIGWKFNSDAVAFFKTNSKGKKYEHKCHYAEPGNSFASLVSRNQKSNEEFKVDFNMWENVGITNIGRVLASGQTNQKNFKMILPSHGSDTATFIQGDGSKRILKSAKTQHSGRIYKLMEKRGANGNGLKYSYSGLDCRMSSYNFNKSFEYCSLSGSWRKPSDFIFYNVLSSDNRRAEVKMVESFLAEQETSIVYGPNGKEWKAGTKRIVELIREAYPANSPPIEYGYERNDYRVPPLMNLKMLPEGRMTRIDYNKVGEKVADGIGLTKVTTNDRRRDRVRTIWKPLGKTNQLVRAYDFAYNIGKDGSRGTTFVADPGGNQTWYVYGKHRLSCITKYVHEQPLPYYSYYYSWYEDGPHKGNLKSERMHCLHYLVNFSKSYEYDNNGNVSAINTRGNFTGSNVDTRTQTMTYSSDGLNLLLSETEGRKTTKYIYKPGTNLLSVKLLLGDGKIMGREFYDYDEYGILICRIVDNGTSEEREDLSELTQRLITRIYPKYSTPCFGLPSEVTELYLDLETGEEKQLRRVVNQYTREGFLKNQEVYDSENQYCYSLAKEYNNYGQITFETNPLGIFVTREYDLNGNMIRETGPRPGCKKECTYDFANRLIRVDEFDETDRCLSKSFSYNRMSYKTSDVDEFGQEITHKYDGLGRELETIYPKTLLPNGKIQHSTVKRKFDLFGNPTSITDGSGRTTKSSYTCHKKPRCIFYADGTKESFRYDLDGNLTKEVSRTGLITFHEYNALGQEIETRLESPNGEILQQTIHNYQGGLLTYTIDPAGNLTEYSYDGAGRKIAVKQGGRHTTYEYDTLGRESVVKQWIDNDRYVAEIKIFDFCDRVIEEFAEDSFGNISNHIQNIYDEMGNKICVMVHTDEGIAITETEYDARKNPLKITDALGNITYYDYNYEFYNELGQRVLQKTTIDPKGIQTIETHDVFGRIVCVEKKDPYGVLLSKVDQVYDKVGNAVRIDHTVITPEQENRKITSLMEYNSNDQLTCLIEATGSIDQRVTRFEYTPYGEKEKIIKPDGVELRYTYNTLGLVEKLESLNAPQERAICYEYSYDKLKNLVSVVDRIHSFVTERNYNNHSELIFEKLGNDLEIVYEKDRLGRTVKAVFPEQREVAYKYRGKKLMEAFYHTPGEGYRTRYQYDMTGKMIRQYYIGIAGRVGIFYDLIGHEITRDSRFWVQRNITYDEMGNLTSFDLNDSWGSEHCDYSYDRLNRLAAEEGLASHTYTHDSINNRVAYDGDAVAINDLNQVLSTNGRSYTYDLSGNLTSDSDAHYSYDALDRLTTIVRQEEKYRYVYDSQNRRIAKQKYRSTSDGWTLDSTVKFIYQGDCEVGSIEDGALTSFRALGAGLGAEIGAAFAIELEGTVYSPTHDLSGNVVALVNALSGKLAYSSRYSAFGVVERSEGISPPYQFSSKRLDPETGWTYFGRRYYDSSLGRWTTCDPNGYSDGYNLYAYVHNNPLTSIDKFGLFRFTRPRRIGEWQNSEGYANGQCYNCWSRDNPKLPQVSSYDFESRFPKSQSSQSFTVGTRALSNFGLTAINGICTVFDGCKSFASGVSEMFDGASVRGIYNATHGIIWDLIECALGLYFRVSTEPALKIQNEWNNFFENSGPDSLLLHICHSQGAIHTRNALLSYPEELRKRIVVIAVAPGAYIYKDTCKEVSHLVSERDPVPWCDFRGRMRERDTIKYLKASPGKIFDHFLDNESYKRALREQIDITKQKYGDAIW